MKNNPTYDEQEEQNKQWHIRDIIKHLEHNQCMWPIEILERAIKELKSHLKSYPSKASESIIPFETPKTKPH